MFESTWPEIIRGVRASSIRIESTSSIMGVKIIAMDPVINRLWPCCRAGNRNRTRWLVPKVMSYSYIHPAFLVGHLVLDDADRQAEIFVYFPHPFPVAAGEVIVDSYDMDPFAGQGV